MMMYVILYIGPYTTGQRIVSEVSQEGLVDASVEMGPIQQVCTNAITGMM